MMSLKVTYFHIFIKTEEIELGFKAVWLDEMKAIFVESFI